MQESCGVYVDHHVVIMDLVLFFLDTFLWYIIWNTVFGIGRSFSLGLSIWTPWKDIYTRLPKRIYAKILATSDMEVKYKPKVREALLATCRSLTLFLGLGFANLERHYHFNVPRAFAVH